MCKLCSVYKDSHASIVFKKVNGFDQSISAPGLLGFSYKFCAECGTKLTGDDWEELVKQDEQKKFDEEVPF